MSRVREGADGRFSYSEPIIPMASKIQGDPDDYFVSNVRQDPAFGARRVGTAADSVLQEGAGDGQSITQDAVLRDAADSPSGYDGDSGDVAQPKAEGRCVLRGNAIKLAFLACAVLVVVFSVYLLQKWWKRRKRKAEDALLQSFILPEVDRQFLEDAAVREKKALQSAT